MDFDEKGKSDTWRKGLQVRRKVLGDEYVGRALRNADDLTSDLQDYIAEHAWGASWTRPGLDHRSRSMITVSMTIALNRPHELEIHLRGALNNGLTRDELKEIMLHAAVYCGAPAALDAFRVARKVFEEAGV